MNFVILYSEFITMAKLISLLTIFIFTAGVPCGYCQSKFVFTGTYQSAYHPMDSILIENINKGSKIVKYYPDTVLYLLITDVPEYQDEPGFSLSQNYPNPFAAKTQFNIYMPVDDELSINIFTVKGELILHYKGKLPSGSHSFTFTGNKEKMYILSAKTGSYSASIKMLNNGIMNNSGVDLGYNGNESYSYSSIKGKSEFEYSTGDNLVFTAYMTDGNGTVHSDTINDSPTVSTTYTFRFKNENHIAILMYHKITDLVPGNEYERNAADFENDLVYLLDHNYQILSMEDLLLLKSGKLELTSDGIVITFDDGYESNYSKAFPLLSKYKMPATFFLVTEWMETPDFMTWSEVWLMSDYRDIDGKKPFNMGSHTSSHPYLEQSSQYFTTHDDYMNFLNTELADSKTWIVDITGQSNIFLSLPFGDGANNEDIITKAIESGYKGIRTTIWDSFTIDKMNLFALPSIPILSGTSIDIIENYLNY
jgi:peptidoglycan/xylan/chitin deacetylase (PgdA/CDA1 family)